MASGFTSQDRSFAFNDFLVWEWLSPWCDVKQMQRRRSDKGAVKEMGTEEASRIANAYRCHKWDTIEVFATPYTVRVKRRLTILTVCKLSRFRLSDCIVVCVIDFLASVTIETAFCRSYLQSLPYLILPRKTHFLRRLSLQVKCPISLA